MMTSAEVMAWLDRLLHDTQAVRDVPSQVSQALQASGCRFTHDASGNERLTSTGIGVWGDYLEWRFADRHAFSIWQQISSTQDKTRQICAAGGPQKCDAQMNGLVVIANEQTAGRGRLGRDWQSPVGLGVTLSLVRCLDARTHAGAVDRLTFAVSVALSQVMEKLGLPATIKWPNDVMIKGRKIAGILVERTQTGHGDAAIIGMGINVHHTAEQLPPRATSLAIHGIQCDRLAVIALVLDAVDRAMTCDETTLLDQWRSRCAMLDEQVTFRHSGREISGRVIDLDPCEGLIIRKADGHLMHLPSATTSVVLPD